MFKFNIDGASKGKPGLVRIRGIFCNSNSDVLFMFSKNVGVSESNEANALAILEALWCFTKYFEGELICGGWLF